MIIFAVTMCFTIVLPLHAMKITVNLLYITFSTTPNESRRNHEVKRSGLPEIRAPPRV